MQLAIHEATCLFLAEIEELGGYTDCVAAGQLPVPPLRQRCAFILEPRTSHGALHVLTAVCWEAQDAAHLVSEVPAEARLSLKTQ